MRYPIGVQDFETIIKRDYLYVDKTDLVHEIATRHVVFLSRPRRFGKSLLISTLDAYFSGKKELFKGLKIDEFEKEWAEYPIFRIDFADGNYSERDYLSQKLEEYVAVWERKYGKDELYTTITSRFMHVLKQAEEQTGHKAVVLIDEYDKPMLDALGTDMEEKNRNTLKGFYGTFKAADAHLRFVLLENYRADVENPLAMLYQSGYLTIKGYDRIDGVYTLDFPNVEVRNSFSLLVANGFLEKMMRI